MATLSPKVTPKRKRGEEAWISPIKFSFEAPTALVPEDGSNSPRSTVAHKFRGLALGSGGGASNDDDDDGDAAEESLKKRHRPDEMMLDAPQVDGAVIDLAQKPIPPLQLSAEEPQAEPVTLPKSPKSGAGASLHRAYPSINRLSDSKSRVKKRSGSPPLRIKRLPRRIGEDHGEVEIVDPVRAALTWHEDEITIYDPEDEDDDGTGINGIGFKPTPALAHTRAMKRRQQMAEYRKREEDEARARRNQRRRGGADSTIRQNQSPSRKVRFTDAETPNIAITTG
ncbi:hypothetical protein B0T10DRAFT_308736 [Thelonectria olida]|uniref:Uncharacterized protein n=1 Tax=Thelonectria olida TaxID=1576542 RepID=A0A9P8W712_9HYPO|nr:hypothetical protein B0T10DRAFT_308736 [Thelonectria olida]